MLEHWSGGGRVSEHDQETNHHDNVNKSRPSKHYVILHKHVPSTPPASGHPEVMHKAAIHECDVNGVTCHVYFHAQAADTGKWSRSILVDSAHLS